MFSVIIPIYNKALYIRKAIYSVLDQTYGKFELIVVNDGSTDNGPDIVHGFRDPRIRVMDQANAGVSTARNNGVKAAAYDYIAFLDADDWWEPNYLEEMKNLIVSYPEAGIYAAKYAVVKNKRKKEANIGLPQGFTSGYINYFQAYARTMHFPLNSSSAVLPRKVFLDNVGFKPGLKLGEDFELWARIALKHPVAFLDKVLVFYNQDVDVNFRGANPAKFHVPEAHFVYNLDQFRDEEKKNQDLKVLLDRLRGNALLKYYLHGVNPVETRRILGQINFENLPLSLRRQYSLPRPLVRAYQVFKKFGSAVKQWIIRNYRS